MDALYQRDLDEFGGDDANQEVPPPPASDPTQHPSWSSPESESPPLSESPLPQSLAPPEFSQQREDYAEPPSPIDLHNASIGAQSHASVGSIGEDIDVNSQGLVEETLERLNRVRGVLGVLILDGAGTVIRTTMEDKAVAKYSSPYATGGSNPGRSSPLVRLAKA